MRLKDKTAIVTGAGRGIGKAVACLFAREGARTVACDIDADVCAETAREIADAGGTAIAIPCNVAIADEVTAMVDAAFQRFGSIDVLANIAGITRDAMIHRMSEAQWDTVIDVNLKGTFLVCQAAAKYMRKGGRGGSIVNVSSTSAQRGNPGQTNYAAAKAGVMGFSRALANEWGSFGIRVNVVFSLTL
jgi:NAD(P)-dependent dehydrogenase (short-subunit alcohol dehydrogenase family)